MPSLKDIISQDIKRQQEAAEIAIAAIAEIETKLAEGDDAELQKAHEALDRIADILATNSANTTTLVLSLIRRDRRYRAPRVIDPPPLPSAPSALCQDRAHGT